MSEYTNDHTARRSFLKKALLSSGAISLVGSHSMAAPVLPNAKEAIKVDRVEFIKLEFPKETPRVWNAIRSTGGYKPTVTVMNLYTDAGITGTIIPKGPKDTIRSFIKKIKGQNLLHVEHIWDYMYHHERKPVAKGDEIKAIGSVDMAVWDIVGKALELPVHRILGTYQEQLPVYAAGGYYAEGKGVPELVTEMEGYVAEGFKAVKIKIGALSVRDDAERIRAVRKALGWDIKIMVDANNAYRAYEAIQLGRLVEDQDLFWFEEPVAPDDFQGCAEVRDALDIPIVAGENEYTRWGARDLIEHRSADILNLDTIKAGGISEYQKIAALASAWHVPVVPHGYAHMNAHIVASLANALIMETYPGMARDFNPALPPFPVKDGMVQAPSSPGLGFDIDPDMIKKYKVDVSQKTL